MFLYLWCALTVACKAESLSGAMRKEFLLCRIQKKGALDLNNENKSTVSAGSFLNAYLSSNIRAGDGSAGAVACVLCTGRA